MLISNVNMNTLTEPLCQMSAVSRGAMRMRLARTAQFMRGVHGKQVDKQGKPYWWHPYRVMKRLEGIPNITESVLHGALLHDVIEDTPTSFMNLWQMGYPYNTIRMVDEVSKNPKKPYRGETYMQWILWIAQYGRMGARLIKIADLADNTSPGRLEGLPKEMRGIEVKYYQALELLRRSVPNTVFEAIRFGDFIGPHYLEPTVDFNMMEAVDAKVSDSSGH